MRLCNDFWKLSQEGAHQFSPPLQPLPFIVHTNASGRGLGLIQSQAFEGEEHMDLYISRKLSHSHKNYAALEREDLAIKNSFIF
ncbi:hypothetical protein QTP86_005786 [Hemibagrus guttatus]|nr:hypothetical protein QTP86_005786 [Hemibagrus guttatus]